MAGFTVYVVDDDEGISDMLGKLLNSAGYAVQTFHSANGFLQEVDPEIVGCVLMDMRMPEISGLQLQSALNERGIKVPVIFMSGYADVPNTVEAMKGGAVGVLEKPFNDDDLLGFIRMSEKQCESGREAPPSEEEVLSRAARLTQRERQVFELLVDGNATKEIANILKISPRTVEFYRARVMEKMQTRNLAKLVRLGVHAGFGSQASY